MLDRFTYCICVVFNLLRIMIISSQVQEFIHCSGGPSSFYGFCEATLDSLLLKVLPVEFNPTQIDANEPAPQPYYSWTMSNYENAQEKQIYIVQVLTEALKVNFNFHFQQVSCPIPLLQYK